MQRLTEAYKPLIATRQTGSRIPLAALCSAHQAAAEAVARPVEAKEDATSPLWQGDAGEAAWKLFEALADPATPAPRLAPADYPDFYRTLIAGETVRSHIPVHPRLTIWGPFEARLQQPDVMILGSLNEGTWPKAVEPGAWLNRPMRKELGLPAPEEETGRAAHDLTTFLGAGTVILTRAGKVDGVPRVASRWLLRLNALLDGLELGDALRPTTPWLAWARARDHIARHAPIRAPAPAPPLAMRPRKASVSDVETWIANPYAIFARQILLLETLPGLGVEPGPQEKGQIIHEALSIFTRNHPDSLPPDIVAAFLQAAAGAIGDFASEPRVRAFWLPRLTRFAGWFAATEPARRHGVSKIAAEVDSSQVLAAPGGPFTLRARADRIDVADGSLIITDYKTGGIPSDSWVASGAAPQLPLEAAMAIAGAFSGIAAAPVSGLRYIRATGAEPPGEEKLVKLGDKDVAAVAREAMEGLARLIARFDDPATPYRAVRRPRFRYDFDDYAHLARVGEWTADDGEGG